MTTKQPEALRLANVCSNLTRYSMDAHLIAAELLALIARITDLEAQLEAIGAGGVSGPLIGQPQAMPDLSQLTERGSKAWAGVDAQGFRDGVASAALASAPAQAAEPSITLDFKMATDLLGMFCGEPGIVTLQRGDEHCHSGPGLYAWYSDMPEEGAGFLGAEPDDEATPSAPSAPAQPAAQPGVAYAALPTSSHAGSFLIGTCPLYTADQLRAFADATHTLRASHGQAPDGAAQADSMQEDAALLDWLEQHDGRYYNLDKVASIVGTGFLVQSEGNMPQVHSTLREAVVAARKQGEKQ